MSPSIPASPGLRRALGLAAATTAAVLAAGVTAGVADAAPGPPRSEPSCASLENCYGYDDMPAFYDQVIGLIDGFSRASYAEMPPPRDYVYVPHGVTASTACGPADATAFQLCQTDDTVYIGQDQLWQFYSQDGDAAAAFAITHEWGHHVQNAAGVFDLVVTRQDQIDSENQADCVGGAFLGYLQTQGQLEPDDLDDVNAILPAIASAEGPERDHGTLEERNAAAQRGFDGGLDSCNAWFPQAPLRTAAS